MRLIDFARDENSQFGEDGMIEHIFSTIGEGSRTCVEFGAADGSSCSNTRRLWEAGWKALLVEGDRTSFEKLDNLTKDFPRIYCSGVYVKPEGNHSIDRILTHFGTTVIDLMSIDVDGIDYHIWKAMEARPRVICIEYNQSIPPQFLIYQKSLTDSLGASAKALIDLGHSKKYKFIGMNKANLFFVVAEEAHHFDALERDVFKLFPYEDLCYTATDYRSRPFVLGTPPWGLSDTPYIGEVVGDPIHTVGSYLDLVKVFEEEVGSPALFIGQDWEVSPAAETEIGVAAYHKLFGHNCPLIILDVANQSNINDCYWVNTVARGYDYRLQTVGRSLFVFTKEAT